jgi:hypothetical protein
MKWDERREKREDVCGMRHVLRRCFAEMTQREEKRLDLIATKSRPSLRSHHVLSLTNTQHLPWRCETVCISPPAWLRGVSSRHSKHASPEWLPSLTTARH